MSEKFRIKRRGDVLHTDIDIELSIENESLNRELMDQPLLFKKWTTLLSEVRKKAKVLELSLTEREAELYTKLSNDGTGKKVKEVESAVVSDENIQKLKRELIEAEELVDKFEGIVKAFYQRHEMLKDLAANKRKDLVD